jgi:uncharacterized repeat protein (TIGR03943 family)
MTVGSGAARSFVLAAWAAMFVVLWSLDEGLRYLGPRTQWVIPFGAVTLTLAAVAHAVLAFTRRRESRPLTPGEAGSSFALLLPIVALLAVPQPELGAQAVSKKRPSNDVLVAQLPSREQRAAAVRPKGTLGASFIDVAVATFSPGEGATYGLVPGARVRVHGLVVHESEVKGTFALARFFISCCAADALPIVIPVDPGKAARPPQDQWLLVTGKLARRGERLVVVPEKVQRTKEPESPYVSSSDGGTTPGGTTVRNAAPPPAPTTAPKRSSGLGLAAGFQGRAANVYDRYFDHCKEYTYEALVYPGKAKGNEEAARVFAGPPREFQPPAYQGCLAGLEADQASIDLRELILRMAGPDEG